MFYDATNSEREPNIPKDERKPALYSTRYRVQSYFGSQHSCHLPKQFLFRYHLSRKGPKGFVLLDQKLDWYSQRDIGKINEFSFVTTRHRLLLE